MKAFLSFYHIKLPVYLVYMLQQVEYNPHKFLKWITTFPNLKRVRHRKSVVWTFKARILFAIIVFFWIFYALLTVFYLLIAPVTGLMSLFLLPFLVILVTYIIVLFGWLYVEEPRRRKKIKESRKIFDKHPGVKIAILGSYGKTSMKELLKTVLSETRTVAATPGNQNVPISHATWAKKLSGTEDVLLIEYGEYAKGSIKELAKLSKPTHAVITGLAPNHLDQYKDLDAVAKDLLSITSFVENKKVFVSDTKPLNTYDIHETTKYSSSKVLSWDISDIKVTIDGTEFVMKHKKKHIHVKSGLLGRHQVAPLAFVAALADDLGLSIPKIESGLAKTVPYEHRMQPRLQHGAWIIDDTYNGSLEGIRAGLELLKELPAKRKVYVTPGLVDQGIETKRVHREMGELIAAANPDRVVLMKNSATPQIIEGLEKGEYRGDLHIEADPLAYYTNLEQVIAAGDLVMLQNDWTDNYF